MTTPDELPDGPETEGAKFVSKFEASLLRILRFFLHQLPPETGLPLITQRLTEPTCLSATCVHLIRDTLSKGCVLYLVRAGAWRRDRYLKHDKVRSGRLWERDPIPEIRLSFSSHTLRFLLWVTAQKPADAKMFTAPDEELTPADELLLFLAYEAVRNVQEIGQAFRSSGSPIRRNALCLLTHPGDFGSVSGDEMPTFAKWMLPPYCFLLEAMQPILLERWLAIERGKGQIGDWAQMLQQGQAEDRVLSRFIEVAEAAQRPDLVRFILRTAGQVLATNEIAPTFWTGGLQGATAPPRLADRLATQRNALALLRNLDRLHEWERRARLVGFMDDGYSAAKLWLADWESGNGEVINDRARRIVAQFDPLRLTSGN